MAGLSAESATVRSLTQLQQRNEDTDDMSDDELEREMGMRRE